MAGAASLRPLVASGLSRQLLQPARRMLTTTSRPSSALISARQRTTTSVLSRPPLRQSLRRGYADQANPVDPAVAKAPKKSGFRVFRWLWRLTYLSTLGGLVYIGYGVWADKWPEDQVPPDPNKKTLVILGRSSQPPVCRTSRHRELN